MTFDEYSALPNKKWHKITDQGYFTAGAASRDMEIEELRQQLTAKDEEIRELVTSDNKVIVDLSRYVETLEQQIADRDEQISDLTISSDTYFAERNSARDVWRRASKDRDELRQQLTASQKREVMLRDAIHDGCLCIAQYGEQPPDCLLEALALTLP